jgi:glycosyltransferase involved in cell wall biosynthesis
LFQHLRKLNKLPLLFQHLGVKGTVRYLGGRLLPWSSRRSSHKIDVLAFYEFLQEPDRVIDTNSPIPARTLNWVIPDFGLGSGGHLNIFRMILHLEQLGYESRIVIVGPSAHKDADSARRLIRQHFIPVAAAVSLDEASLRPAEFTIATEWRTAYSVRRFNNTRHKVYFIQDMEPYFFARGSDYVLAEATYRFGFTGITAGPWLAEQAHSRYGMSAYPFGFSYEKDRYRQQPRRPGPRRVFFYARPVTPRRGFELGLLALARVHKAQPDIEFVLAGWDCSAYAVPFPYLNAGIVALDDLSDLYNQCDVALVLSFTNISLLPLELMACGCPVVSNRGPNVEWMLVDGETALLAEPKPDALAEAILRVVNDAALRARLAASGLAYARATDWALEAEKIHGYFERIRSA